MKVYQYLLAFVATMAFNTSAYAQDTRATIKQDESSQIRIKNTEQAMNEDELMFPPTSLKGGAGFISFDKSDASKWDSGLGLSFTAEMGHEGRKLETGLGYMRLQESIITLPVLAKFELKNFNGLRPSIKAGMAGAYATGNVAKDRTPYDVLAEFGVGLEGRMDQKSNWFVDVMAFRGLLDANAKKGEDFRQGVLLSAGLTFKAL